MHAVVFEQCDCFVGNDSCAFVHSLLTASLTVLVTYDSPQRHLRCLSCQRFHHQRSMSFSLYFFTLQYFTASEIHKWWWIFFILTSQLSILFCFVFFRARQQMQPCFSSLQTSKTGYASLSVRRISWSSPLRCSWQKMLLDCVYTCIFFENQKFLLFLTFVQE